MWIRMLAAMAASALLGTPQGWAAAPEGSLVEGMVNPGYHEQPEWFKLSFLDIREDIREAADADKRVMLYFYQDGCPYCAKLLQDNFGQREITEKTRKHFDVIAINLWGDREVTNVQGEQTTEKQFAADHRVMFTPTLLFLDEKGEVALRVNGYYAPAKFDAALEYAANGMESKTSFAEYYKARSPTEAKGVLHPDPRFLEPPYDLTPKARDSDKPLVVFFEQKSCRECDELHGDVMTRERTDRELRRLDAVSLDQWSRTEVVTPEGNRTTAREWARELDVKYAPTLVFFDADGEEVFRTEAYLKSFHIQGAMAYVHSGAYQEEPSFQRFLQARRAELEAQGENVDLWD